MIRDTSLLEKRLLMTTLNSSSVQIELERILYSRVFKKSIVLSNFLEYVIMETLDGKTNEIKEHSIANSAGQTGRF